MKEIHSSILHFLKEFKKPISVSNLANQLKKSEAKIREELDILDDAGLINITRKGAKNHIQEAQIIEPGISAFYNDNKIFSKEDIQIQIDKLREAVDLLNVALNASSPEEKKGLLEKADKLQSVLNGGYQLFNIVSKML